MARIQVLNLPGGPDDYLFAIIIDEWPTPVDPVKFAEFKDSSGARALMVTSATVEVL